VQTERRCFLSDQDALRFQIELNSLRPPTRLSASREQLLGQIVNHAPFYLGYGQSRQALWDGPEKRLFHCFVHPGVQKLYLPWVVDIFYPYFSGFIVSFT